MEYVVTSYTIVDKLTYGVTATRENKLTDPLTAPGGLLEESSDLGESYVGCQLCRNIRMSRGRGGGGRGGGGRGGQRGEGRVAVLTTAVL